MCNLKGIAGAGHIGVNVLTSFAPITPELSSISLVRLPSDDDDDDDKAHIAIRPSPCAC